MNVNLYIQTSHKGTQKRAGVGMWILEYINSKGDPVTRTGFVHTENGTGIETTLKCIINGLTKLICTCEVKIYTDCTGVYNTISNGWVPIWKKADWINAKGKEVKNADLWEMYLQKIEPHTVTISSDRHEYSDYMATMISAECTKEPAKPHFY